MSWLQALKRVYSLDTLDTRLTIPATTPPKDAIKELQIDPTKPTPSEVGASGSRSNGASSGTPSNDIRPSLWGTPEFYLYYLVFIIVIPTMFTTSYDVSKCMGSAVSSTQSELNHVTASHPSYSKYSHLLSDGWIPGRKVVCH
jgi:hypothetical protein